LSLSIKSPAFASLVAQVIIVVNRATARTAPSN
jgi:hypothetical protein